MPSIFCDHFCIYLHIWIDTENKKSVRAALSYTILLPKGPKYSLSVQVIFY